MGGTTRSCWIFPVARNSSSVVRVVSSINSSSNTRSMGFDDSSIFVFSGTSSSKFVVDNSCTKFFFNSTLLVGHIVVSSSTVISRDTTQHSHPLPPFRSCVLGAWFLSSFLILNIFLVMMIHKNDRMNHPYRRCCWLLLMMIVVVVVVIEMIVIPIKDIINKQTTNAPAGLP